MGMATNPRDAMIQMMYLVLTAMLALNVSASVLNAFVTVDGGIRKTTDALDSNLELLKGQFEKKAQDDPDAAKLWERAQGALKAADELAVEIDTLYEQLITTSGAEVDEHGHKHLLSYKDTETPSRMMVVEPMPGETVKTRGEYLKERINEVRESFLNVYETTDASVLESVKASMTLQAEDAKMADLEADPHNHNKDVRWEAQRFSDVPVVAALAILSKLKNDVKTTEADLLDYLKSQIGVSRIEFDALTARAIGNKGYLTEGERYEAEIFVSASSTQMTPIVYMGGLKPEFRGQEEITLEADDPNFPIAGNPKPYGKSEGGIVKYSATASGVGEKSFSGVIEVKNKKGQRKFYPFRQSYTVTEKFAVVAPTKMNVLYKGLDNPISVSAPGYQLEDVTVTITGGGGNKLVPQGKGTYLAQVKDGNTADIVVSVKGQDGAVKELTRSPFRLKKVPDPKVSIMGSSGPALPASKLKSAVGVAAKADNFPYDVKYTVLSYDIQYKKNGTSNLINATNKGLAFTQQTKKIVSRAGPGDRLWVDAIKVKAPDGSVRTLSLSFKVIGG